MKGFNKTVDDYTFHGYQIGDPSLPTLVCLHGLTADANSFIGLIEYLIKDFHLILLDSPGHGESQVLNLEEDYMFSSIAKRIYRGIQLITNESIYMLGHSWGADLALNFTKLFPNKVKGVILLDGGYVFPEQIDGMTKEKALEGWQQYIDSSIYNSWDEIVIEYQNYTTKQWDSQLDSIISSNFKKDNGNYVLKANRFSILSTIKAFYREPCSTTYNSLECPILLFHATIPETDSSRNKGIQKIKKNVKNVKVIGIENTKHNIHWDCPDVVANEILLWKWENKK